jgi:hypothetical protein
MSDSETEPTQPPDARKPSARVAQEKRTTPNE